MTQHEPFDLPKVVTLCGSTRFWTELAAANLRETAVGHIVLAPGCNLKTPHELWADPEQAQQLKERLDRLHRAKIRMADEVLVVNPGGYVGLSTLAEIAYATSIGVAVRYTDKTPAEIDHPDAVYADAAPLEQEFAELQAAAASFAASRDLAASRTLTLRKAAYLDRAALALAADIAPGLAEADALAETAALELRRFDHAFGTRLGHVPPHARQLTDGNSRRYTRQEYRHWLAGHTVPVSQCDHHDNCPTTECAYSEGYYDRPEHRDPNFPVDQDREDWNGWPTTVRL
ncbi:hypothetical protein [Streptomyces sp. CA-111067]|uniref:hypothetical protein n=1 Tax=Streptomyces sp. CA-111067 TaxID=3240046 RepID=UPI003D97EDF9